MNTLIRAAPRGESRSAETDTDTDTEELRVTLRAYRGVTERLLRL